jgi:hypothetical protein
MLKAHCVQFLLINILDIFNGNTIKKSIKDMLQNAYLHEIMHIAIARILGQYFKLWGAS